jgi:hypothetical protein
MQNSAFRSPEGEMTRGSLGVTDMNNPLYKQLLVVS